MVLLAKYEHVYLNVGNSNKLISHNLNNHKAIYYDLNIDSADMKSALQICRKINIQIVSMQPLKR